MWFFRARVDSITTKDGQKTIARPEERYYIGYVDEMTKQDAKKRRDEMLSELINKPQVLISSQVKFSEVLKIYRRDHVPQLRDTSQKTEESFLRLIEPTLGPLRLCDFDALSVQRWLSGLGLAWRTKQNYLGRLRVIWRCAEDWGYTQHPFPRGKYSFGPRRDVKGRELPTMDNIRRLLAALDDPYKAMAEIALYAGLRISEIRGLQWQDVGTATLTVRRRLSSMNTVDSPKNGKIRVFDIRPLAQIFKRLPRTDEWLFHHSGSGYTVCREIISAAATSAGINTPRFGWHHLRAIANTLLRSSGADSLDRQALLGHADERMNALYVMQAEDDVKRRGDLMLAVQSAILGDTKGVM